MLCDMDPRVRESGLRVTLGPADSRRSTTPTIGPPAPPGDPPAHVAWFFELTDGTTCRPLAAPGREVEGTRELYGCRYGSNGGADAVLGDLDATESIWTIRKVLINKKTEPQTVKSLTMAAVQTVWQ